VSIGSGVRLLHRLVAPLSTEASGAPMLLFGGAALALTYLVVPPLVILIQTSFWVTGGALQGSVGIGNYSTVLASPELPVLLRNSLIYAVGSSIIGLTIGGFLAWLIERTNVPFKNLAYGSAFVALAVPEIVKAIGWVFLLGPRNGLVTIWIKDLFQMEELVFNLYSIPGMILVTGILWSPSVLLLMSIPFRAMDRNLEEAAATSGATDWQTFWRVTFPLARPTVLSLLLLTFVRSLEAFEVPAILGLPGRVFLLTTEIYLKVRTGILPDYGLASAYAILLMGLVAVGVYLYSRATRLAARFSTITGKAFRPRQLDLGRGRYLAAVPVLFLPLVIILPILLLSWAALQPFYSKPSWEGLSTITLRNFAGVFSSATVLRSISNSLIVGISVATCAVLLASIVAWLLIRTNIRRRFLLDYLVSIVLVFPGVVMGVAILRTYLTLPIPVYGTIWILVIAYITQFLPYAMRFTVPGLIQIDRVLEESAYTSGARRLTMARRILFPLLFPALFGAWIWLFLVSMRELSIAAFLSGPGSQVVSTVIFELWQEGRLTEMAAYAMTMTSVLSVMAIALQRISRRWGLQF
jgi:iron(III) transport system permease protein